jgi:pimeloyl-ACP methyl ester carboxylesterase
VLFTSSRQWNLDPISHVPRAEVMTMTLTPPPAHCIGSKETDQNFVLIHGMVMAPSFWQVYAPEVVRRGNCVAYPLPGHHPWHLDEPGRPPQATEVARSYVEAIRRDFGGRPVTLIGHSTGGFVSLLIAREYPELVRSIILIGAFACGRFEGQERLAARLLRAPRIGLFLFRQFFSRWISSPEQFRWGSIECVYDKNCPWQDDQAIDAMEGVRRQLALARPDDIAACIRFMSETTLVGDLGRISVPVLNMVGANDAIVPPAHQLRVSRLLPRVQTVVFGNCGHLPMVERREQSDRTMSSFLDTLDLLTPAPAQPRYLPFRRTAASEAIRLLAAATRRREQTRADSVHPAQDTMFHIGLGEAPNEYNSHRHSDSASYRRAAELGPQPQLGIWPVGRPGPRSSHPHHLDADGPYLT